VPDGEPDSPPPLSEQATLTNGNIKMDMINNFRYGHQNFGRYMNTDLYPGKSKTVPPPILSTRLMRSLIKISMIQKPTLEGNNTQWFTCTIYILHEYLMNFSSIIQLIKLLNRLTFEMFASSRNCLEQIQQFVSESCRYTW